DQGFPGTVRIKVTYTLSEDDKVIIHYHATSDADTVLNLTNHAYFNLAGEDSGDILGHLLTIHSSKIVEVNSDGIPTGALLSVAGTAYDFAEEKPVGADIDKDEVMIQNSGGYDINYVLDNPTLDTAFANVKSLESGITMDVYTTLPGVQFYSGNSLGDDAHSKSGVPYVARSGLCLETQFYPDSPNQPDFPSAVLNAGKDFDSYTIYAFNRVDV
ncbi:MAG: galactose mutarotase, partial [Clostridiales Family XIII bacterium]|nr:galactose mutarotase [Clostridiales Family XIII bacterium]